MPLYAAIDVGYPDDPKVIDAGDLAELVYLRCVLRSRQHLTDGVIDRRVLTRWLAGVRGKPATHMERLVEVGLLCTHPDGWCIPLNAWKKWNPTKLEVEEKREAEKQRKADYRARMSQRDKGGTDADVPDASPHVKPEPEPEPAEKPTTTTTDPVMDEAKRITAAAIAAGVAVNDEGAYTFGVYQKLHAAKWTPEREPDECDDIDCDRGWIYTPEGEVACLNCYPWLAPATKGGN